MQTWWEAQVMEVPRTPSVVVVGSATIISGAPVDGYHHLGSIGTGLSWSSWLICLWAVIIACMASVCLLALLPVLHSAKAISPHSNMSLIWGMVIPSPVKSLATSLRVTLSNSCASVMHGVVVIVRHNSSTRCWYNPSVDNNCATQMRNTLLVWCAVTLHSALTVTINRPLINDRLIPYQALRIPGHITTSLGYLHNHLAHSSGGSVV